MQRVKSLENIDASLREAFIEKEVRARERGLNAKLLSFSYIFVFIVVVVVVVVVFSPSTFIWCLSHSGSLGFLDVARIAFS